jgi:hypothetical protein
MDEEVNWVALDEFKSEMEEDVSPAPAQVGVGHEDL